MCYTSKVKLTVHREKFGPNKKDKQLILRLSTREKRNKTQFSKNKQLIPQ